MMDFDVARLQCGKLRPQVCGDGSVRIVQYCYRKPDPADELLTLRRTYAFDPAQYALLVHLPPERTVDILVTVARLSKNHWRLTVSCDAFTEVCSYKTMGAVNIRLRSLFDCEHKIPCAWDKCP